MIGEDEVARCWDANSSVWADQVRKGFDVYRELVNNPSMFELIGPVNGLSVLDIGCGEGYNTRKLARLGAHVAGIDLSAAMIASASAAEERELLGITYHVGSFARMATVGDRSVDLVVAFMSLMDGPGYEAAVRESYRVLKPEGCMVFSITHPCFLTEGMRWITDENSEARLAVSNYFSTTPYLDRWKFSLSPEAAGLPEFEVAYFPRTLSGYLNPLLRAGFQLLEIREPMPSEEDCRRIPSLGKWRQHAAIYLQVKARKGPSIR